MWKLHNLEGTQELTKGHYSTAKGLFEAALAELGQSGEEPVDEAIILSNLGMLYQAEGKYPEAQQMLLHAVEMREAIPGVEECTLTLNLIDLGRELTRS
jgi:Flp pilus assembly protein TadD